MRSKHLFVPCKVEKPSLVSRIHFEPFPTSASISTSVEQRLSNNVWRLMLTVDTMLCAHQRGLRFEYANEIFGNCNLNL